MKLFVSVRAPNPRRVQLFLAAKQLDLVAIGLQVIQVDLSTQQNRQDDYLQLNPLGQIPALQLDDGSVIADSMAICRYLELSYPAQPLFGESAFDQAKIDQLSRQAEQEVLYPMIQAFQHGHPFWAGKVDSWQSLRHWHGGVHWHGSATLSRSWRVKTICMLGSSVWQI